MKNHIETFEVNCSSQVATIFSPNPPRLLKKPAIIWDLNKFNKRDTNGIIFNTMFQDIIKKYPNYALVFTDGSKSETNVGCAFKHNNFEFIIIIDFPPFPASSLQN